MPTECACLLRVGRRIADGESHWSKELVHVFIVSYSFPVDAFVFCVETAHPSISVLRDYGSPASLVCLFEASMLEILPPMDFNKHLKNIFGRLLANKPKADRPSSNFE
jgi:hypothetical protein